VGISLGYVLRATGLTSPSSPTGFRRSGDARGFLGADMVYTADVMSCGKLQRRAIATQDREIAASRGAYSKQPAT
jgi:hypothetical protein